jgi:Helicase conserved C-terminal domain
MSWRDRPPERLTLEEAYQKQLSLEAIRPLGRFVAADPPTRKGDLVPLLSREMKRIDVARRLYDQLDARGQAAVREATHDPSGAIDAVRFAAKYDGLPTFGTEKQPTPLRLFLPRDWTLPADLHALLRTFVPAPAATAVRTVDALPEAIPEATRSWRRRDEEPEAIPLRLRATATAAPQEVRALLRLVEAGKVRVSDKTRKPPQATIDAIRGVLVAGDFYEAADQEEYQGDPASDLAIRAFSWPLLLQGAELATPAGGRLELTTSGRKALGQPAHAVLRAAWRKWLGTTQFDEFQRIDAIKGQGKGRLTAAAGRRKAVAATLQGCPPLRWIGVDELFRFLRASGHDFTLARNDWGIYIGEQPYGSFGENGGNTWEKLQGRFILALLFEAAATLGLVDVAYVPPQRARDDYSSHWGADDLSCLSRYDGLKFVRINALGAWILGLAEAYAPEVPAQEARFRVLPNLDVVAGDRPPEPADALLLDRVAERTSDRVWRLSRAKALEAVGGGMAPTELEEFLAARGEGPLPQPVQVFLADLRDRAGKLRDLGLACLIECADAETAALLAHDRELKRLCQVAGDRLLVVRTADEDAVRKRIRKLGYIVPPRG